MVRDQKMIAFIHTHKTAGTSFKWILRSSYGIKHLDIQKWDERKEPLLERCKHSPKPINANDIRRCLKYNPYLKSICGHTVMGNSNIEEVVPNVQYVTFLRDPLKQTASWFQYLINVGDRKDLKFEDYIRTEFPRNRQTKMIAGCEDVNKAIDIINEKNIFVGLTEQFDESLLLLKKLFTPTLKINYSRKGIAKTNRIKNRLLQVKENRELIMDATKSDRILYDYIINNVYPKYVKQYGDDLSSDLKRFKNEEIAYNMINVNLSRFQSKVLYDKLLIKLYRNGVKWI